MCEKSESIPPRNSKLLKRAFTFTTLIDDDQNIVQTNKACGISFSQISKAERKKLIMSLCDEIRYVKDNVETKLCFQDIVILKNGEIGAVTKMFANGTFCISKKKVLYRLKEIAVNFSIIHDYEQTLLDRNRFWCEGTPVEVFSNSSQTWCDGKIEKVFYLKSEDESTVHPEKWYSLSYMTGGKRKYKQLQWHNSDLRQSRLYKRADSSSDEIVSFSTSDSDEDVTPSSTFSASHRNSIFE